MTLCESQTESKVEARKRVYSALAEVKRLLSDLDIVPNMRDYFDPEQFRVARQKHANQVRRVVDLQNEMTAEAKMLQKGGE